MLREDWTGEKGTAVPVATHIIEMRERLAEMTELVAKHTTMSQVKQKQLRQECQVPEFPNWRSGVGVTSCWSQQTQAPMDWAV